MTSELKFVLVVGASGSIGNKITKVLIRSNKFKVFVLVRNESKTDTKKVIFDELKQEGATLINNDVYDVNTLKTAFQEYRIDTIICAISGYDFFTPQKILIDAALESKTVKRFLPSEFGVDVESAPKGTFFDGKKKVEEYLKEKGLPYTLIYSGLFYEFVFSNGFGFDTEHFKAVVPNGGNFLLHATDTLDIAKYIVEILLDPTTANKAIVIEGQKRITFNDAIKIFEKASSKQFERVPKDSVQLIKEAKEAQGLAAFTPFIQNYNSTNEPPNYEARVRHAIAFTPQSIEQYATSVYKK